MDDRERIEALAADGRITREEAERLLSVLDDIDSTEQELGQVDEDVRLQGEGRSYPGQPPFSPAQREQGTDRERAPGAGPMDQATPDDVIPDASAGISSGVSREIRWVEVELLAGDLLIEVDASLQNPVVRGSGPGSFNLEHTERGARLTGRSGHSDTSVFGRLLGGVARGEVRLSVPEGWGVKLDMKAGDVEVHGPLACLAGNLLAGDLDADQLHGVDLTVKAGDIDLSLLLTGGDHRIQAVAGDMDIRLLDGSDAKIRGRVNIGDISLPHGWERNRRGLGSEIEQTVGEGAASLALELGTGDLKIGAANG